MPNKRILSIGQCAMDHGNITNTMHTHFHAEVVPADNWAQAEPLLTAQRFDLVLINRLLDADGSDGLAVLDQLKQAPDSRNIPAMLVTNYPEHQATAVARGAVEGFGKASLGQPAMLGRVRPFLE